MVEVALVVLLWTVLGFAIGIVLGRVMHLPGGAPCEEPEAPIAIKPRAYLS